MFKKGHESLPISIIDILKKSHEENQKLIKKEIEHRKKANIPLSDAENEELALIEFDEDAYSELKDLRIVCRAVSTLEVVQVTSKFNKAIELKDPVRAEIEGNKCIVEFLKSALVRIEGFKDIETGLDIEAEFTDELADTLIQNRALLPIYRACRIWQELSASEKKTLERSLR